jgi:hypothetical protein
MVVDGTDAFVGSDVAAARRAIERAAAAAHGRVSVAVSAGGEREIEVSVTASGLPAIDPGDRAEITVAIVEDGLRSDVRRGENAGRQLTHAAVARLLTDAGRVEGPIGQARLHAKLGADWARDRLTVIAFVQARASRRVLATAATLLPR